MLLVFIKSVITFFLVFFVIRLMGKRQLGEMQPFELVITLIIAEVACIPMNDPYIPIYYGIIPIITLTFLQILFSYLSQKFLPIRKMVSGRAITVIDKEGINYENLKSLNMNVSDLMELLRSNGTPDIMQVQYAIVETSGKICVVEKEEQEVLLPLSIILNGKWIEHNVDLTGLNKQSFLRLIEKNKVKSLKNVVYADVRQDGTVYVATDNSPLIVGKVTVKGGNW